MLRCVCVMVYIMQMCHSQTRRMGNKLKVTYKLGGCFTRAIGSRECRKTHRQNSDFGLNIEKFFLIENNISTNQIFQLVLEHLEYIGAKIF